MKIEDVWNEMTDKGYSDAEAWEYVEAKYPDEAQKYMDLQLKKLMRQINDHLK